MAINQFDKPIFTTAVMVGNICGLLYLLGMYPASQHYIDSLMPKLSEISILGESIDFPPAGMLHIFGSIIGAVVAPFCLSLFARRPTLIWSFTGLTCYYGWRLVEGVIDEGANYFWQAVLILGFFNLLYLTLFAFPPYFYRRSQVEKTEVAPSVFRADRDVWPPPPSSDLL